MLAKIAEMPKADRALAKRIHALVKAGRAGPRAEDLVRDARLREGRRQDRLLLQERGQVRLEVRDVRLREAANLDKGAMWPTSFALTELTDADEAKLRTLVKRAAS